jgi:hypothetical protein
MGKLCPILFCFAFLIGCSEEEPRPEDALGTGRLFIRSLLDGEFKEADRLLYQDSFNQVALKEFESVYRKRISSKEKTASKKAAILIHQVENVNDSVAIIYYSSSLQQQKKPLRIIRKNGIWQVDFYYAFSGNL